MKVTAAFFFAVVIILLTNSLCRERFRSYKPFTRSFGLEENLYQDIPVAFNLRFQFEDEKDYAASVIVSDDDDNASKWMSDLAVPALRTVLKIVGTTDDSALLQQNVVKGLSPYSDATQQQQPTSEKSLKVSADSRKWRKGVIGESRHAQSNVHDRIKKAFEEVTKVQNRAKRGLGLLTSCLTNAVGAALLITL